MRNNRDGHLEAATLGRSYLISVGLVCMAIAISAHRDVAEITPKMLPVLIGVCAVFLCGGVGLILYGLFGPSNKMAGLTGTGEPGELFLAILVFPVYLLIALFYKVPKESERRPRLKARSRRGKNKKR